MRLAKGIFTFVSVVILAGCGGDKKVTSTDPTVAEKEAAAQSAQNIKPTAMMEARPQVMGQSREEAKKYGLELKEYVQTRVVTERLGSATPLGEIEVVSPFTLATLAETPCKAPAEIVDFARSIRVEIDKQNILTKAFPLLYLEKSEFGWLHRSKTIVGIPISEETEVVTPLVKVKVPGGTAFKLGDVALPENGDLSGIEQTAHSAWMAWKKDKSDFEGSFLVRVLPANGIVDTGLLMSAIAFSPGDFPESAASSEPVSAQ